MRVELEPTYIYPIKKDRVYAMCMCPLPVTYGLDLGKRIAGKIEYPFKCKKCGLEGKVITNGS